jgi:hypothetical protein
VTGEDEKLEERIRRKIRNWNRDELEGLGGELEEN